MLRYNGFAFLVMCVVAWICENASPYCPTWIGPLVFLFSLFYSYLTVMVQPALIYWLYLVPEGKTANLYTWVLVLFVVVYHLAFALELWSILAVMYNPVPDIPAKYSLTKKEVDEYLKSEHRSKYLMELVSERDLEVYERDPNNQRIRICKVCSVIKPDRAHHCRRCGRCFLRMDHHCRYLNTCISIHNHKAFILFMVYSIIYVLVCYAFMLHFLIVLSDLWMKSPWFFVVVHLVLVGAWGYLMAIMASLQLFPMIYNLCLNRTTIEELRSPLFTWGPAYDAYDTGPGNSFKIVFGSLPCLWLLPLPSQVTKEVFEPTRAEPEETSRRISKEFRRPKQLKLIETFPPTDEDSSSSG